jgi:hypothetical protein
MSKSIPKVIKQQAWNKYYGEEVGKVLCPMNCGNHILQSSFEAGHIISRHNGGSNSVNNLIPICRSCNGSMSSKNMDDYIRDNSITPLVKIEIIKVIQNVDVSNSQCPISKDILDKETKPKRTNSRTKKKETIDEIIDFSKINDIDMIIAKYNKLDILNRTVLKYFISLAKSSFYNCCIYHGDRKYSYDILSQFRYQYFKNIRVDHIHVNPSTSGITQGTDMIENILLSLQRNRAQCNSSLVYNLDKALCEYIRILSIEMKEAAKSIKYV